MFQIICLVLLSSTAFAANFSAQELADFAQEDIESEETVPFLVDADQPMPGKAALIKSSETGELVAVVLPEDTYSVYVFVGDKNDTNLSDDMKKAPLEEVELVLQQVIESEPNSTALHEEPEFKINNKVSEPAITEPPMAETNSTSSVNITNISANETKPEKSFLERIEEGLGISTGGSSALTFSNSMAAITLVVFLMSKFI